MEQQPIYSQEDDRITDEIDCICEDDKRECERYNDVIEGESYDDDDDDDDDDEEYDAIQNNLKIFMTGVAKKLLPGIIKKKMDEELILI